LKPVLFIFSGLPGTGKTTLAKGIARYFKAAYLRLDTIEHGIGELCGYEVQGEGYRLAYRIAADNLLVGNHVVADCCNPWELTRREWNEVAAGAGSRCVDIEVTCSDRATHRARVESRESDIAGFAPPDWDAVSRRRYERWGKSVISVDTSVDREERSLGELLDRIKGELKEET